MIIVHTLIHPLAWGEPEVGNRLPTRPPLWVPDTWPQCLCDNRLETPPSPPTSNTSSLGLHHWSLSHQWSPQSQVMKLTQSDLSIYYLSFVLTTSTLKDLNYYDDLTSNQSSIHQTFIVGHCQEQNNRI